MAYDQTPGGQRRQPGRSPYDVATPDAMVGIPRGTAADVRRAPVATNLRSATAGDPTADDVPDEAALRGEVLPLGNSVLEDIQGTFS